MSGISIGSVAPYTQATAVLGQFLFFTNWTANAASDVIVFYTPFGTPSDDATQQLQTTQFSIEFIGDQQQVQVTLVGFTCNAGDIITITRMTPDSFLNIYTNTNFLPSMLNNDFGILTLVDQQAQLVNQLIAPRYNYSAVIAPNSLFPNANIILPILGANETWVMNPSNTAIVTAQFNTISAGSVNLGTIGQLAYYAATGTVVSGLNSAVNASLLTNALGMPAWVTATGTGAPVLGTSPSIGTPTLTNSRISGGFYDTNAATILATPLIASAVNFFSMSNSATGNPVILQAQGSDTNVILELVGQGNTGVLIKGRGDSAHPPVGFIGELLNSAYVSGVSMTSGTVTQIQVLNLTAGDWDVWATYQTFPAATTVQQQVLFCLNTTTASIPAVGDPTTSAIVNMGATMAAGVAFYMQTGVVPITVSTNTPIYLNARAIFTVSTLTAGGIIMARRRA